MMAMHRACGERELSGPAATTVTSFNDSETFSQHAFRRIFPISHLQERLMQFQNRLPASGMSLSARQGSCSAARLPAHGALSTHDARPVGDRWLRRNLSRFRPAAGASIRAGFALLASFLRTLWSRIQQDSERRRTRVAWELLDHRTLRDIGISPYERELIVMGESRWYL